MDLAETLQGVRSLEDLTALAAAMGSTPLWDPVPAPGEPTVVVGCRGDFAWYAVAGPRADTVARALAKKMAARGRICGTLGLDPVSRRLTIAISLTGAPRLVLDLDRPTEAALEKLRRLATSAAGGAASFAAHAVDALGGETVGLRYFRQFRCTLERMAAGLPGPLTTADRHAIALLQLTRILFLYFVQARGMVGRQRAVSGRGGGRLSCPKAKDPPRPAAAALLRHLESPGGGAEPRCACAGLHPVPQRWALRAAPLERRLRRDIPNDLWRDAFDGLFERFHFTLEADERGGVAPDMLGRVFEGVMAPMSAARRVPTTRPPRWCGSCSIRR